MITRLVLRLPWFLSAPLLIAGALLLAVGLQLVAGTYFERTFRDDVDPLAGVQVSGTPAAAGETVSMAAVTELPGQRPAAAIPAPSAIPTAAPPAGDAASSTPALGASGVPAASAAPVASTPPAPAPTPAPTAAPAAPAPPPPAAPAAGPAVLLTGMFVDGDPGHFSSGRARLIRGTDGALALRFEEFSVTNGPDVFVVLSTDPDGSRSSAVAGDALNLGRLKATNGNINYAVPPDTDLSQFRSVIVYCRAFRIVMGWARLAEVAR